MAEEFSNLTKILIQTEINLQENSKKVKGFTNSQHLDTIVRVFAARRQSLLNTHHVNAMPQLGLTATFSSGNHGGQRAVG